MKLKLAIMLGALMISMLSSVSALNQTSTEYYCPTLVLTDINFTIWVDYEYSNGTNIENANVTVLNPDGITRTSLIYDAASSSYGATFSSSSKLLWDAQLIAEKTDYETFMESCLVRVEQPFNLTINLWEEVELSTYANTSEYIVTIDNYNKDLTDPYINDFAYILVRNNDFNATGAYNYCNIPYLPGKRIWDIMSVPDYMGNQPERDSFESIKAGLVPYIGCDRYWYTAEYTSGTATVELPFWGNYSIFLIEGTMTWENQYAPPTVSRSDLFMYIGDIYLPDKSNVAVDFWLSHDEIDFWSAFSDEAFLFMVTILPILLFAFLTLSGVSAKTAGATAIGWNVLISVLGLVV